MFAHGEATPAGALGREWVIVRFLMDQGPRLRLRSVIASFRSTGRSSRTKDGFWASKAEGLIAEQPNRNFEWRPRSG